MRQNQFQPFDTFTVNLEGKNLVEASAGTGKTFSIGILLLRLVLEKKIRIEKALLVTFTNNAVAELESRIRLFIRDAQDYAVNKKNIPEPIRKVVDKAIELANEQEVQESLKGALLFLDQLSIMTIHGFCRQTLQNQAFETGQLFGSELVTTMDDVYEFYANNFWRKHINTLPFDMFKVLKYATSLSPDSIYDLIKNYYAGKVFFLFDETQRYTFNLIQEEVQSRQLLEELKRIKDDFARLLARKRDTLTQDMLNNRYARNSVNKLNSTHQALEYVRANRSKQYINNIFAEFIPLIELLEELEERFKHLSDDILNKVYCFALQEITCNVNNHVESGGLMSFNSLIKNLHTALSGKNKELVIRELQAQYDAVFVDEFQDTDKLQYEIFKTAFHRHTILFYIGDPKQSIYAFRQADINTYFKAREDVDHLYTMNKNFRSTKRIVDALNRFFLPEDDFDTFLFERGSDSITYFKVDANNTAPENDLFFEGSPQTPLTIEIWPNNEGINTSLVNKVAELLTDPGYTLCGRRVKPSDIGILVKGKKRGKLIKDLLSRRNIPAIMLNDDKIMASNEAFALYHVLRAMHNPTAGNIRTGLVNVFTGKRSTDILSLKGEQLIELFRNYKALWESRGINLALAAWMKDFGIRDYLIQPTTVNGLRIISNLEQLKELLIKTEYLNRLNPDDLLDWMKRAKDLELLDEDESVIRLENDADSVTITTIHKSKGLEYNIVFCPEGDMALRDYSKDNFIVLYENSKYLTVPVSQLTEDQKDEYDLRARQEVRRLLYVALTRTVYSCFLYRNTYCKGENSTLIPFLEKVVLSDLIRMDEFAKDDIENNGIKYTPGSIVNAVPEKLKSPFKLSAPNWRFMSYSGLTPEHQYTAPPVSLRKQSEYDEFVFEKLRRGNITGTMLHEIFEKIDFQNTDKHDYIIRHTAERYAFSNAVLYQEYLPVLIDHVTSSIIQTESNSFRLKDIPLGKRLPEMEFDFPVGSFDTGAFTSICRSAGIDVSLLNYSSLYGMMNGFIDMFFEHEGKFYVLDWKSNFLGNTAESYAGNGLAEAMHNNNYHLQYIIYTLAISKYLKQRLPAFDYKKDFGGVIYCFIRGMRSDKENGVFFKKASPELISDLEALIAELPVM